MINDGTFDFSKMSSALVAEVKTRNSTYKVRFVDAGEYAGTFEVSGGVLTTPLHSKLAPFIVGIDAPMFVRDDVSEKGMRTSGVHSVTFRKYEEAIE